MAVTLLCWGGGVALSAGMYHSISLIGLGILIYNLLNKSNISLPENKFLYSILEIIVFGWVITNSAISKLGDFSSYIYTMFYAALFVLFILKKGIISQFFDKDWCVTLGKYSFSLYMIHWIVLKFLHASYIYHYTKLINRFPVLNILLVIALTLLATFLVHNFIEKENKYRKKIFGLLIIIGLSPVLVFRNIPLKTNTVYMFNKCTPQIFVTNRADINKNITFTAKKSRIYFKLPDGQYNVHFKFISDSDQKQNVLLYNNKREIGKLSFDNKNTKLETDIVLQGGYNSIKLELKNANKDENKCSDKLCIAITEMSISRIKG